MNNRNPKHLIIETNLHCNMKCTYCKCFCQYNQEEYYPLEDIKRDFDYLTKTKNFDIQLVCVYGGESLLHPDIDKIVEYIHDKGYSCYIISNGLPLFKMDKEKIKRICDNVDSINISKYTNTDFSKIFEEFPKIRFYKNRRNPEEFSKFVFDFSKYKVPERDHCECVTPTLWKGKMFFCECFPGLFKHIDEKYQEDGYVNVTDIKDYYHDYIVRFLKPCKLCGCCCPRPGYKFGLERIPIDELILNHP